MNHCSTMLNILQQHNANRVLSGVLIPFRGMSRTEQRQRIRRENFALLRKRFKTATQMADSLGDGFSSSYLSQLLSGHRGIGDDIADKIEAKLGLPSMWLDQEHKGERQADWDKLVWLWEHADAEIKLMLGLLTGAMYEKKRLALENNTESKDGTTKPQRNKHTDTG